MARKDVSDELVCEMTHQLGLDGFPTSRRDVIQRLMEATGECAKVCEAAAERSYARGLIDCGVSIRWPWLTQKGDELLASVKVRQYRQNFHAWLLSFES